MKSYFLLTLLFVQLLSASAQESEPERLLSVNMEKIWREAPAHWLETVAGEAITSESFQDKVVIVNFWFIGCMPCMKEIPTLNRLHEKIKGREEVLFLSLAPHVSEDVANFIDPTDTVFTQLRSWLHFPTDEQVIKYPIVATCTERTIMNGKTLGPDCHELMSEMFGLGGYPLTLLIGRNGKVAEVISGFEIDEEKIVAHEAEFLSKIQALIDQ